MTSTVEYELHVHYGFVYFRAEDGDLVDDLLAAFGGQANGICGARYPGMLALITGLHTGVVQFVVTIAESEPELADEWEDAVEVSFEADDTDYGLAPFDDWIPVELPAAGSYRARYCALGMDAAHEQDTRLDDDAVVDRYELQLWPAPPTPEKVLRVGSTYARYWHNEAARFAPPRTEDELDAE